MIARGKELLYHSKKQENNKETIRPSDSYKIVLMLFIIMILVLRVCIVLLYSSKYIDHDQALMWNGASAASHFQIPEPCFWGQSYGSMLEALLAVPLLWIGVPFQYALPIIPILLSFAPFGYISYRSWSKGNIVCSIVALSIYTMMGLNWDILTSVPRSLISGMPIAVFGAVILNENGKSKRKVFIGAFLLAYGSVLTNSAALISSIGFLYWLLSVKQYKRIREIPCLVAGCILGGVLYFVKTGFYQINSDYALHPTYQLQFSWEVLRENIDQCNVLMRDFNAFGSSIFMIIVLSSVIIALAVEKHWKTLILVFTQMLLTLIFMSMPKTRDYTMSSVLFSQTRMFLYLPFSALLIVYYDSVSYAASLKATNMQKIGIMAAIAVVIVSGCLFKITALNKNLLDPESKLLNSSVIGCAKTGDVIHKAETIKEIAKKEHVDVIIFMENTDSRIMGYTFDALYYGEYLVYNSIYDRRTWNYHQLQHNVSHRCLIVHGEDVEIVDISQQSVVDYISSHYDQYRNPYFNW